MAARVLAGLLLGPPFLGLLWYGGLPLAVLVAILGGRVAYEGARMAPIEGRGRLVFATLWAAAIPLAYHFSGVGLGATLLACGVPLLVSSALASGSAKGHGQVAALTLVSVVLGGFMLGFLVLLRAFEPNGRILVLALIAMIWTQDTAAYFVGTAIGRHKISPISPKKSWEGTIGGLIFGVLAAMAVLHYGGGVPLCLYGIAGLIVVAALGQVGDLFESLLKRDAGIKDSSSLIPGHGGVLDRFDSTCAAAPALYLLVEVLKTST